MLQNAIQANQANAINWVARQNKISLRRRDGKALLRYAATITGGARWALFSERYDLCDLTYHQDLYDLFRYRQNLCDFGQQYVSHVSPLAKR